MKTLISTLALPAILFIHLMVKFVFTDAFTFQNERDFIPGVATAITTEDLFAKEAVFISLSTERAKAEEKKYNVSQSDLPKQTPEVEDYALLAN